MDINFELYKTFYFVARRLSFSGASAELYISQSAVSQAIKQLESKLGCRLFFRHTKQVRLTPEGQVLFQYVEQAVNLIKAGERYLNDLSALTQGEVRIAATDTICKYYLLPYFKQFVRQYPQIKLRVTNRSSPECLELLKTGSVDVIVINLPEQGLPPGFRVLFRKTFHDCFVAGPGWETLKGLELSLSDLQEYPLLLLEPNSTTRDFLDTLLRQHSVTLRPEIELDSVDLLVEMVRVGLGITFVSKDYIARELAAGRLFTLKILQDIPERSLGVVVRDNLPLPAAARKFTELGFFSPDSL